VATSRFALSVGAGPPRPKLLWSRKLGFIQEVPSRCPASSRNHQHTSSRRPHSQVGIMLLCFLRVSMCVDSECVQRVGDLLRSPCMRGTFCVILVHAPVPAQPNISTATHTMQTHSHTHTNTTIRRRMHTISTQQQIDTHAHTASHRGYALHCKKVSVLQACVENYELNVLQHQFMWMVQLVLSVWRSCEHAYIRGGENGMVTPISSLKFRQTDHKVSPVQTAPSGLRKE
jgi:hypothetical protein